MPSSARSLVIALLVAASAWACSAGAASAQTQVGRISRNFVDPTRPRWGGGGDRPLDVLVWYPAAEGASESAWYIGPPGAPLFRAGESALDAPLRASDTKFPLVVMSHGTGGSAAMLAWLGERLAAAGYVVAAVNHHGNTAAEPTPRAEGFVLWWERAMDLSVLLDRLAADRELGPTIDWKRVGAAGFSLGGYTVLALAGARVSLERFEAFCESPAKDATCSPQPEFPDVMSRFEAVGDAPEVQRSLGRREASFRDPRVRAVFALAPIGTWLTDESLRSVDVPVQVVVGSDDTVAPAQTNAARVTGLIGGSTLSVLEGVRHYTFLAECTPDGASLNPELCRESAGVDRTEVHRMVGRDVVTFFDEVFDRR